MWKTLAALPLACAAFAQAPAASPTFDVATIKVAEPIEKMIGSGKFPRLGANVDGAQANYFGIPLPTLITIAYKVKPFQISGPSWFPGERFDIQARIPDGVPKDQAPEMLKALLMERFKLVTHTETKDHPVYVLSVAKGGPKLKEPSPEAIAEAAAPTTSEPPPPPPPGPGPGARTFAFGGPGGPGGPGGGDVRVEGKGNAISIRGAGTGPMKVTPGPDGTMHMEFAKATIQQMADILTPFIDKPIVNETGLTGEYQFALDLRMQDMLAAARNSGLGNVVAINRGGGPGGPGGALPGGGADASDPGGSSIFQAVQQLGLKLEPKKAPMEMIVVDRVEKLPTEN